MTRELLNIGNKDVSSLHPSHSANPFPFGYTGTSHRTLERPEHEFATDDTIETRPVQPGHEMPDQRGDIGHIGHRIGLTRGQRIGRSALFEGVAQEIATAADLLERIAKQSLEQPDVRAVSFLAPDRSLLAHAGPLMLNQAPIGDSTHLLRRTGNDATRYLLPVFGKHRNLAGEVLTEGPAVLQYVADLAPESGLAPAAGTLAWSALVTIPSLRRRSRQSVSP